VIDEDLSYKYFEVELQAYRRLRLLQGQVVPILFGHVAINGSRCLLLQDVGGVSLTDPEGALLGLETLTRLLDNCLSSLTALGVLHEDAHPANFRLVDGRLFALDFEMSEFDLPVEENAFFTKCEIGHVGDRYQEVRRLLWFEGLLQSASDKA
jgi:tRNA A-37 threonylcarbamoyl transferase component Bud32